MDNTVDKFISKLDEKPRVEQGGQPVEVDDDPIKISIPEYKTEANDLIDPTATGKSEAEIIEGFEDMDFNDYFAEEKKKEEEAAKSEELAKPDPIKQAMSDDVVNEEIQRSLNKIH